MHVKYEHDFYHFVSVWSIICPSNFLSLAKLPSILCAFSFPDIWSKALCLPAKDLRASLANDRIHIEGRLDLQCWNASLR